MALKIFEYKVYKRTFLKSVRWLFSYKAEEDKFVDRFVEEMKSLSFEEVGKETKAVMMKKQGIMVLANAELLFVNCATDVYQGFNAIRSELISLLRVLEKMGIQEITSINCVKENSYTIDKSKLKTGLTESQFANILFTDLFAAKPPYVDSRDGIQVLATRSFSDSITESTMQLLVTVTCGTELPLSAASDKLEQIDKASYDAWSSVISNELKQFMER